MPGPARSGGRRFVFSAFLLVLGVIVGVAVSSEFRIVPSGEAVGNAPKATTAPPKIIGSEQAFISISKAVRPAVVNITAKRRAGGRKDDENDFPFEGPLKRFFGEKFGGKSPQHERRGEGMGSGVIIESDGLIVTNNHVIEDADEIVVILSDKREFEGVVVGADPKSDLAVIRIKATGLPTIPWGDSAKMEVGAYVLAIGNPFGLTQTVTMGIISAVGRANIGLTDYEDFIQTDAAINPGNSGGAMVNMQGELIGINTAIFTRSGGYMGIGFAVPSDMVRSIVGKLVKNGKVVRGWLGVAIQDVTPQIAKSFGLAQARGALVSEVMVGSPAEKAGFQAGDVILSFGKSPVGDTNQLRHVVAQAMAGDLVNVDVIRDNKALVLTVKIEIQPRDLFARRSRSPHAVQPKLSNVLQGVAVSELNPELAGQLALDADLTGVVILKVDPGSNAGEAGLRKADLILEVNRKKILILEDYEASFLKIDKTIPILLLVRRQDRTLFLTVTP